MATKTVPRNVRSAFLDGARAQGVDIEDCLVIGRHYLALAQWIEQARHVIEEVDLGRRNWPELDQALKARDICTGLEWTEVESGALVHLMQEAESRFAALYKAHFPRLQEVAA